MNGSITQFLFEGEALVRVVSRDGEPWFVAKDVCGVLGIVWKGSDSTGPLSSMDDDEKGVQIVDTLGGAQEMIVVSESGLYALVFRSRKPAAHRFRKWVTGEVLPSIRKTGGYSREPRAQVLPPISDQVQDVALNLRIVTDDAAEFRMQGQSADVVQTRPAHRAGDVRAKRADRASLHRRGGVTDMSTITRRTLLAGAAAATVCGTVAAPVAGPHPDAKLIATYAEFRAFDVAWHELDATESDEENTTLSKQWDTLFERVASAKAKTLEGLAILALISLRGRDLFDDILNVRPAWGGQSQPAGIDDADPVGRALWNLIESARAMTAH